jgi:ABC-type Zn2+ transport system substrate-binding protein/surface adhesin
MPNDRAQAQALAQAIADHLESAPPSEKAKLGAFNLATIIAALEAASPQIFALIQLLMSATNKPPVAPVSPPK